MQIKTHTHTHRDGQMDGRHACMCMHASIWVQGTMERGSDRQTQEDSKRKQLLQSYCLSPFASSNPCCPVTLLHSSPFSTNLSIKRPVFLGFQVFILKTLCHVKIWLNKVVRVEAVSFMKNEERQQDVHSYRDKHKVSYKLREITPQKQ